MKVVLFCGGQGFQLPGQKESIPKPMTTIGYRPILWHVMRYYAHFGFKDFVLSLGYRGDVIKSYFLRYNEALSNDFILSEGGNRIDFLSTDIEDWNITFVDTGLSANIGERLKALSGYFEGEEIFFAGYADSLTDAPLPELLADFKRSGKVASVLSVRPNYSFHLVSHRADGLVTRIDDVEGTDLWVNGGCFIFRKEVFDYIAPGEDLVEQPFRRLIARGELITRRYTGFWAALDTLKDLATFQSLHDRGRPPWAPWLEPTPLSLPPLPE